VVAASLSRRTRESPPDAEWLDHLRRFFVEAMEQSTVVVAPHVDSIIRDALHLAPAGPLFLLAIQNIGGVGMQLLQSFVRATALLDSQTLPIADPSDMHIARHRQTPRANDLLAAAATLQAAESCGSSHASALTGYRAVLHAHLSAQDSRLSAFGRWLAQSWDVTRALLLAPVRRVRAAIVLHRFATRRIRAARAREQLLTIDERR
jgi:hypothetical protein